MDWPLQKKKINNWAMHVQKRGYVNSPDSYAEDTKVDIYISGTMSGALHIFF